MDFFFGLASFAHHEVCDALLCLAIGCCCGYSTVCACSVVEGCLGSVQGLTVA